MANEKANKLVERYLDAVVRGDRQAASSVVEDGIRAGRSILDLYLEVLLRSQGRLGILWQRGSLSVAEEHRATQITLDQMEHLRSMATPLASLGVRSVVTAVEGDEHMVGARAVADFLAMDGWRVDFLGPNTPTRDLAPFVLRHRHDLVALSVSMDSHLDAARQAIVELKGLERPPKIIVGGAGLAGDGKQAEALGADGTAPDALSALRLARRLVGLEEREALLEYFLRSLGQRVQLLRKRMGWSQGQLADRSGLDRAYISAVENGKQNLTLSAVMKLASAFEVPMEALLTGVGVPPAP